MYDSLRKVQNQPLTISAICDLAACFLSQWWQASARIFRWSLYLSMFEYTLKFRNTTAHANADPLSSLPLPEVPAVNQTPSELVLLADHLSTHLWQLTRFVIRRGKIHSWLLMFSLCSRDGQASVESRINLLHFLTRQNSQSIKDVYCGDLESSFQPRWESVLTELHEGHPGGTRMKGLSRMYVWWPGVTKDIESTVCHCSECQQQQSTHPVAPLHCWAWPRAIIPTPCQASVLTELHGPSRVNFTA